jgi:endonuclease III
MVRHKLNFHNELWAEVRSTLRRLQRRPYHRFAASDEKCVKTTRAAFSKISSVLKQQYGSPRLGNVNDPFSELLYIFLSSQTQESNFKRTWAALKAEFPGWSGLDRASIKKIARVIKFGGLSNWKAPLIKNFSTTIRRDFGSFKGLNQLRRMEDCAAEMYLTSLPGIKIKSARCVMLYSLGRSVFPMDTNTFRVFRRLGIMPKTLKERPVWVHNALQEFIVPSDRYDLHVNLVAHGRTVCRSREPVCQNCVIASYCDFFRHSMHSRKQAGA